MPPAPGLDEADALVELARVDVTGADLQMNQKRAGRARCFLEPAEQRTSDPVTLISRIDSHECEMRASF